MKKRLILTYVAVFGLVVACEFKGRLDSKSIDFNYELVSDGFFDIQLDSITSFENSTLSIVELAGFTYLVAMDNSSRHLNFYNFNDPNNRFFVPLESEGPNAIIQPFSFYVHNLDSIFIYDYYFGVRLINSNGEVSAEYDIGRVRGDGFDAPGAALILNALPMRFRDGKIHYMSSAMDWDLKIMSSYDLTSKIEMEYAQYPQVMRDDRINNFYKMAFHTFTQDKVVISFPLVDSLYVYSFEGHLEKKIYSQSIFFDRNSDYRQRNEVPKNPSSTQIQEYVSTFNRHASYFALFNEPGSELLFRFCILPELEGFSNDPNLRPFTIVVSDLDGNIYSELVINEDKYFVGHPQVLGFVFQDKFYLQRRDILDDDLLRFEIFSLREK